MVLLLVVSAAAAAAAEGAAPVLVLLLLVMALHQRLQRLLISAPLLLQLLLVWVSVQTHASQRPCCAHPESRPVVIVEGARVKSVSVVPELEPSQHATISASSSNSSSTPPH